MTTLKNLFLEQLAEMYEAEQEIARALSTMMKLVSYRELKQALKVHAYETVGHISKVAQVFACFGEPTTATKGSAISGLLAEAAALVSHNGASLANDAAIIAAVQKIEHYEIATYGCLRDWAAVLNNQEAANLLEVILEEEKSGDHKLTQVASLRNVDALEGAEWHVEEDCPEEEGPVCHGHGHERATSN